MQAESATLDVSFGGSWEVARCSGPEALDGPTLVQALGHTVGFGHLCSLPSSAHSFTWLWLVLTLS